MSTSNSFLGRFIRVLAGTSRPKRDREVDPQSPIRWLNLR